MTPSPVVLGEVLFDRFPDGTSVLGGAPFNVAWHLAAFGLRPAFVSRVGEDEAGERVRRAMKDWGMDDRWLQNDPDHPTGAVDVSFPDGSPSYSILPGAAYDFLGEGAIPAEASVIYHGTLALRSAGPRAALDALCAGTGGSVFLDVNLRDPWWNATDVATWLERARWAKLNDVELDTLDPGPGALADRVARFQERFALDALFVTRGKRGSLLRTREGRVHEVAPEGEATVVDTVGAGDAFTAVALLGLVEGWSPEVTQRRAQDFASALVGIRGATCRDRSFYEPFRTRWRPE